MIAGARIAALALWLLLCLPFHLLTRLVLRRSNWPRRFLAGCGWICGLRVRTEGQPPQPRSLLICNHVSWLDIFAIAGATGCAFVSKDELRQHPVGRWLADMNGTLYVRRDDRRGASLQADAIAKKLQDPQPVALFPEGTTGSGKAMLPFRPTLLAAVTPPPPGVTVRPVAIDYGAAAPEIGWLGESAKENVLRILGRRGTLPVTIRLLGPLEPTTDRKAMSGAARTAIERALTSSRHSAGL